MDTIHKHPLKSAPGMRFEYSNFGYAILGEVIERKTGMSYVEFVNTRLFEPIGMDRQNLLNVELINNE
jgi:CubicO group peptidase (beta-lactamase class C family)